MGFCAQAVVFGLLLAAAHALSSGACKSFRGCVSYMAWRFMCMSVVPCTARFGPQSLFSQGEMRPVEQVEPARCMSQLCKGLARGKRCFAQARGVTLGLTRTLIAAPVCGSFMVMQCNRCRCTCICVWFVLCVCVPLRAAAAFSQL